MSADAEVMKRLDALDEQCRKLGRRCRILQVALALAILLAALTPAFLLYCTNFGSELRVGKLAAERIVVVNRGELSVEGFERDKPVVRLGYLHDENDARLVCYENAKPTISLRSGTIPSLKIQRTFGETSLILGYGQNTPTHSSSSVSADPSIVLNGPFGVRQASLAVASNGEPNFVLFGPDGRTPSVHLCVSLFGKVLLHDPSGNDLTGLELSSYPKVNYLDQQGKPVESK